MELFGHAQRMCKNITVLTGLPCTVAKGNAKAPCGNPASCTQTACLSRRSGRHLYQCPCGRTFLITSLHQPKTQDVCHIIVGPFAIEQTEEPLLPIVTHEELASLDEILQALGGYLSGRRLMSPEESLFQNEALQTMSVHMDTGCEFFYPLEQERRLQQLIRSGSKQEARQLLNEILDTEDVLLSVCGYQPRLFRPPEGCYSEVIGNLLVRMDYVPVIWSVDTLDWKRPAASAIENRILGHVKSGDIILCHDYVTKSNTPAALRKVIPALLEEGYEFVTVSELMDAAQDIELPSQ